jgi:hypothetical protein
MKRNWKRSLHFSGWYFAQMIRMGLSDS